MDVGHHSFTPAKNGTLEIIKEVGSIPTVGAIILILNVKPINLENMKTYFPLLIDGSTKKPTIKKQLTPIKTLEPDSCKTDLIDYFKKHVGNYSTHFTDDAEYWGKNKVIHGFKVYSSQTSMFIFMPIGYNIFKK